MRVKVLLWDSSGEAVSPQDGGRHVDWQRRLPISVAWTFLPYDRWSNA